MITLTLRDDDANGTTPVDRLERLYEPLWARGIPMALALIPEVRTDCRTGDGALERFVVGPRAGRPGVAPLADNRRLVELAARVEVLQHGRSHGLLEGGAFELTRGAGVGARLDGGRARLAEVGLTPVALAPPQDGLCFRAYRAARRRYRILVARALPWRWHAPWRWPSLRAAPTRARRIGDVVVLSHRGELPLGCVQASLGALPRSATTGFIVHHWSFFDASGRPDREAIAKLHATLRGLEARDDVRLVSHRAAARALRS